MRREDADTLFGVQRPFRQVDVFSADPLLGNPLAVVLDGDGLDDDAMRRFARWTNLSETTFLLAADDPEADYRVRIFTPAASCRSPAIPRWAPATSGSQVGGRPRHGGASSRSAPPA